MSASNKNHYDDNTPQRSSLRLPPADSGAEFTIVAVTVLALGIGANTAVFSLVHTLLFQSPGYPPAARRK